VNCDKRGGGGVSGGMDRKDSRSSEALVHVTKPANLGARRWEAARRIGSLLSSLQLPKTNRLSCICTPIMLTYV
jgi:hypothetical protein